MNLREIGLDAYETGKAKGFYDSPATFGERIALIHSELSEALEDFRAGERPDQTWYENPSGVLPSKGRFDSPVARVVDQDEVNERLRKPCGIPSELADAIIRIADLAVHYGIDLDAAVAEKLAFNKTRPHKHGGKKL